MTTDTTAARDQRAREADAVIAALSPAWFPTDYNHRQACHAVRKVMLAFADEAASQPVEGLASGERDEARRMAGVLRIAQDRSQHYGDDMIRAANMLDRLAASPATRPEVLTSGEGAYDPAQIAFDQQCDDPAPGDWNDACLHIAKELRESKPASYPVTQVATGTPIACRFIGVEYSQADLGIAQRAACAIAPFYGTGDHGEQEAARAGKLWNDHPAVQGALRAVYECRALASMLTPAIRQDEPEGAGVSEAPLNRDDLYRFMDTLKLSEKRKIAKAIGFDPAYAAGESDMARWKRMWLWAADNDKKPALAAAIRTALFASPRPAATDQAGEVA